MANFIISPYAISWDSIKNQLNEYIKNKSETQTWKDFYASGAGETVVEIAAALGAFYAYHFIMGRRECNLSTAQNYTSIIGLAQNAGYSAGRGNNLKIKITYVNNTEENQTFQKWDIIGSYSTYDLVVMSNDNNIIVCEPGASVEIPCVIGNLVVGTDAVTIPSKDLTSFSFHSNTATNDLRLILNNDEVPASNQFKDLVNDKWVIITNTYGCVDAFYLNTQDGGWNYKANDILYVQFIERNNLTWSMFSSSNLNVFNGNYTKVELLNDATDVEDIEQVKLKAPLYHETNMVIRSRKDYSKYLLLANNDLIDANDRDITPGLIELTYLKRDGSLLSNEEIEYWLDAIEETRPSGVARALISHPVEVPLNLNVKLWYNDEDVSTTIEENINELINSYNNKLGQSLDLNQIEHDIERLNGIKIARVSILNKEWTKNTNYQLYDIINASNGKSYYVDGFNFKTGYYGVNSDGNPKQPDWPQEIGATVVDGDIEWERVDEFADFEWKVWEPNKPYNMFDCIRQETITDSSYGSTGSHQPIFSDDEIGAEFDDYHVIWRCIGKTLPDEVEVKGPWKADTVFFAPNENEGRTHGDIIYVRIDGITNYFECIKCYIYMKTDIYRVKSFVGKSSSIEPEWGDGYIIDNVLTWKKLSEENYSEEPLIDENEQWKPNHSYAIGNTIKTVIRNTEESVSEYIVKNYTVTSLLGTSANSDNEPTWTEQTGLPTYDNTLIWRPVATEKTYSLGWNQYFKLTRI